MSEQNTKSDLASRRHLLKLGAMAAPAVITLAPASARAAVSTLHCFVPVEQPINENGQLCTGSTASGGSQGNPGLAGNPGNPNFPGENGNVPHKPGNPGRPGLQQGQQQQEEICYGPPPSGGFTAQQIQNGFGIDGISDDINEYKAYTSYLRNLRSPTPGASCMVSINMTGR